MSIYFDSNYNIHADALVTGYTAGIKFSPDGTLSCKAVSTGYTGIKFSPDYTIYCKDMVIPISPILNNNDWATISDVAKAGTAAQYWSVGDYKEVRIAAGVVGGFSVSSGTERAVIIGINHNPTYENPNSIDFCIGQNTSGIDIVFNGASINSSLTTAGGWTGSEMYLTYLPQFYNLLSGNTGLQNAMIAPKKYTHNATGGSGNNSASNVTLSENASYKLFLMAEYEILGARTYANSYEKNKQAQYAYYSSSGLAKSKIRYNRANTGSVKAWWTRSPNCGTSNTTQFVRIATDGTANASIANGFQGYVPCFRVGLQRQRVGGTIFYIDSSSTNTYTFYNASGTQVSAPTVGTDCTDWTYEKTGSGADKFYVYESTTGLIPDKYWGYYDIITSATGKSIGDGKTNTSKVLAITDTSSYASGSIWEYIKNMRTNRINNCDDWFVGCDAELEQLRLSGTTGAGWFSSNGFWSSREIDSSSASVWAYNIQTWGSRKKRNTANLVPIRAF